MSKQRTSIGLVADTESIEKNTNAANRAVRTFEEETDEKRDICFFLRFKKKRFIVKRERKRGKVSFFGFKKTHRVAMQVEKSFHHSALCFR